MKTLLTTMAIGVGMAGTASAKTVTLDFTAKRGAPVVACAAQGFSRKDVVAMFVWVNGRRLDGATIDKSLKYYYWKGEHTVLRTQHGRRCMRVTTTLRVVHVHVVQTNRWERLCFVHKRPDCIPVTR